MATNKPISGFPTLAANDVQPNILLITDNVNNTSSSSTGTTEKVALADALNNPNNGTVAGQFVPQLGTASAGKIVKTAQNGMVFQSPGGSLTDFSFLSASGLFIAGGRASDEALLGGKLVGIGAVPSIAVGTAAGSGATASVVGSNTSGIITLNTGTGTTVGLLCTLTFSNPYTGAAVGNAQFSSTGGPNYPILGSDTTSTTLKIYAVSGDTISVSANYKLNYQVIGYGN